MLCNQVVENLSAYWDNELSPQEKEAISAHISTCDACHKRLAHLQKLSVVVQASVIPAQPRNLAVQVMAQAHARHAKPSVFSSLFSGLSNWWLLETPAMHAVAVASVLVTLSVGSFLGWGLSSNRPSSPMTSTNQTVLLFSDFDLDVLTDVPEGSLPHAYLTLSSAFTGKGN